MRKNIRKYSVGNDADFRLSRQMAGVISASRRVQLTEINRNALENWQQSSAEWRGCKLSELVNHIVVDWLTERAKRHE